MELGLKVKFRLSAITRKEYVKVIDMPDDISEEEISDKMQDLWDNTYSWEFEEDWEYFEKGHCFWEYDE